MIIMVMRISPQSIQSLVYFVLWTNCRPIFCHIRSHKAHGQFWLYSLLQVRCMQCLLDTVSLNYSESKCVYAVGRNQLQHFSFRTIEERFKQASAERWCRELCNLSETLLFRHSMTWGDRLRRRSGGCPLNTLLVFFLQTGGGGVGREGA